MTWVVANLAPLMFAALALFLLSGVPVAFALAACGLSFGMLGIELGVLPPELLQALPLRLIGILANETLLAIPFFTFMGLVLQRSGMAEDLLQTVGEVFGAVRGGLAIAVVLVGALLAATTGVVAASVISMGLISLPIMLRYGYQPALACGVITASGSLAQVVPPSLVLIVMADQLGRSVGDMYRGALLPAALLIAGFLVLVTLLALLRPRWLPALPPEARAMVEPNGASGHRSLIVLAALAAAGGWAVLQAYPLLLAAVDRSAPAPADERVMVALAGSVGAAFVIAWIDRLLGLHALSALARRVAFVLVPPLILIFLVLGTIFLGVATPTEGGALGATGALALAALRRRLSWREAARALLATTKLSCFVMFVLIGATVFSLSFQAVDGGVWVEHLFDRLPGGPLGFLVFVTALVFVLGFFLDFFEIAFILLPLLAPIATKLGIDLIWFGVLIGINLQTSFMTPPFGFSLFYLRSVAPSEPYADRVSGRTMPGVRISDIYLGALPFVAVQVAVMALVIAFPALVLGDAAGSAALDRPAVERQLRDMGRQPPAKDGAEDPMQLLLESMEQKR